MREDSVYLHYILECLDAIHIQNADCGLRIAEGGDVSIRNPKSEIRNPK